MTTSTSSSEPQQQDAIHYVIVVHGIGEQRKNETILPAIRRLAAVRHDNAAQANVLSLGRLTSQSFARPWIEFTGIPAMRATLRGEWTPRDSTSGDNLRFIDFTWSDIMRRDHPEVGQPPKLWTAALIARLSLRPKTDWIRYILRSMRPGVLLVQRLLSHSLPNMSQTIFNNFLGDVELYGDYPRACGATVPRHHGEDSRATPGGFSPSKSHLHRYLAQPRYRASTRCAHLRARERRVPHVNEPSG